MKLLANESSRTRLAWAASALCTVLALIIAGVTYTAEHRLTDERAMAARSIIGRDASAFRALWQSTVASNTLFVDEKAARVLYLFRTDCPVCSGQRTLIADYLDQLHPSVLITVSTESLSATAGYWEETALAGTVPVQVLGSVPRGIGIEIVPTLITLDEHSQVRDVLLGRSTRDELRKFVAAVDRRIPGEVRKVVLLP